MKIKSTKEQSVHQQLVNLIKKTFPTIQETGLNKDLGLIHPDPKSKGKAVLFTWRKATLRITENLKIQELNFCNTLEENTLSQEASSKISEVINSKQLITA